MDRNEIEKIFLTSDNSDEIFDTFVYAIKNKINDFEIYSSLLWNKSLSKDEICMYIKKIATEFPELSYKIYYTGALTGRYFFKNDDNYKTVFDLFKKASEINRSAPEPYIKALELYDPEFNIPNPNDLIDFVNIGLKEVKDPTTLLYKLSNFYGILNNNEMKSHYLKLAEQNLKKKFNNHKGYPSSK